MKQDSKKIAMNGTKIFYVVSFIIIAIVIVLSHTGLFKNFTINSRVYEENGIKYRYYKDTKVAEVIKSPNANGKITIPSYIIKNNIMYNVITISEGAFNSNNNIQEIFISEGIKTIEYNSLPGRLSKISVPNSIENFDDDHMYANSKEILEKYSYNGCEYLGNEENPYVILIGTNSSLTTSLDLPDGLRIIKSVYPSKNIKNVTIPDSVISIEAWAFLNCTLLENIIISETSNLKYIKTGALSSCEKLNKIYIPKNCVNIDGIRNYYGSINRLYDLKSIEVHPNNKYYDSRENCNAIIETKTNELLVGCGNTIIPDNITVLGNSCFASVDFFNNELKFPNSLRKIESYAFAYSNIKSVKLNKSLEKLGSSVFYGCNYLEEVIIDKNVTEIGTELCGDCNNLKKLVLPFIGKNLDTRKENEINLSYLFYDTKKNRNIEINNSNLSIYINPKDEYTIRKGSIKGSFNEIYFLENVTVIQSKAFDSVNINNLYIAKSVNDVGKNISDYNIVYDYVYSKISGKIYLESSNLGKNWNINWNNINAKLEYGYNFNSIYSELEIN